MNGDHVPVLLDEAVAALALKRDGVYVDATFGRGGHSRRMLEALAPEGMLVAIDRDPEAEAIARAWRDPRFHFHRAWFSELPEVLGREGLEAVDGVLLDLGVASTADRRSGSADFRFVPTVRSTCAWTRRADRAPRNGSTTSPNVNSGE